MKIVVLMVLSALTLISLVIGVCNFMEKGLLFNNAYLYASKEERERMNKKPYYRQSAIIFLLLGLFFLLDLVELVTDSGWLFWINIFLMIGIVAYAIVSSVRIEKVADFYHRHTGIVNN